MSNQNPHPPEKKGLLSGLAGLFKQKPAEPAPVVPEKPTPALSSAVRPPEPKPAAAAERNQIPESVEKKSEPLPVPPAPVVRAEAAVAKIPQGAKSKHFRDEFEVFVSGKKSVEKNAKAAEVNVAPRSFKSTVAKSADLSKEFDFFTRSSKPMDRKAEPGARRVSEVKPSAVVAPPVLPPPPPILVKEPLPEEKPAVLRQDLPTLVPPPPPKLEPKEPLKEKPKTTHLAPVPSAPDLKEKASAAVNLPNAALLPPPLVVTKKVVVEEKKADPVKSDPVKSVAVVPPAAVSTPPPSVSTPVVTPAPTPAQKKTEPLTIKKVELIDKSQNTSTAPIKESEPTARATIKKVELDSNRRKRPVVILPPMEGAAPAPAVALAPSTSPSLGSKKKDPVLVWVLGIFGFLLVLGLAIYIYQITRETSAEVLVATDELTITGSPLIVYNYEGQVSQIKRDYAERRAPIELRLQEVEADLAAAKADLAGRLEKKRLLTEEIQKLKNTIPDLTAEAEKKLDLLWKDQGGALDKAYADQKEALHQEIEKRVQNLGLKYRRNTELDALEVAVNAFRLALYGAPKEVNVDEQRVFSEDILTRWKAFEKDWSQKQLEIKDQAMKIKLAPGPRIEITEKQLETLRVDLEALNVEVASLQEEVNRRQEEEVEEQEKLRETEKPFLADLLAVPQNNILRELARGSDGVIRLEHLEKVENMPPGDYLFFVQAQSGGEIFWAVKPLTISQHKKTILEVSRGDFVNIRKLIQ
jgi:gas vesicle protein